MGKGWKNPLKVENANKKGAIVSKMAKEISVAARLGGGDPNMNARLRTAIEAAKVASVPRDTIERAIKKGTGDLDDKNAIEEVMYEGFGPHQVGVLVECQTDNRARTAPEMRFIFKKNNGMLGEQGSVAWMFDRVAYIVATHTQADIDVEGEAIEAGANDMGRDEKEGTAFFYGNPEDLDQLQKTLKDRGWTVKTAELTYKSKNKTDLTPEQMAEVVVFLDALDDNEDVARLHTTVE